MMHNSATINLNVVDAANVATSRMFSIRPPPAFIPRTIKRIQIIPIVSRIRLIRRIPIANMGGRSCLVSGLSRLQSQLWHEVPRCSVSQYFRSQGTWTGGREKAPAAICRKVASARTVATIEIWGDGKQTRSFLYIDECLEGVVRLMRLLLYRPRQYRLGGNGYDQSAGRYGHWDFREALIRQEHTGAGGSSRSPLGQSTHQGETRMGTKREADRRH